MCVYKEPINYLQLSIESILNQTYIFDEFIIVVDNPQHIEAIQYIKEMQAQDDRIVLLVNDKNYGLVYSLNRAINESIGNYIVRMDADDISYADRITESIEYLMKNGLDLVGTEYIAMNNNNDVISQLRSRSFSPKKIAKLLRFTDVVPHPTWICKKSVYVELCGYRNIPYAEDYDFLLRALNKNMKIGVVDKVLLQYRINEQSISNTNLFRQFLTAKFLSKHRKRLDKINIDAIKTYVESKYTDKKNARFITANKLFLEAKHTYNMSKFQGFILLMKSFFTSRYYAQKYFDMLRKKFITMF